MLTRTNPISRCNFGSDFPSLLELRGIRFMADGGDGTGAGGGDGTGNGSGDGTGDGGDKTFSQADVDRIVGERVQRERAKYADYDELKAKAGEATTLEQRLGAVETELTTTKHTALRNRIAALHGISTEKDGDKPSPAEVLLTGSDEAAMTAQASLYAAAAGDKKKTGGIAPKEGTNLDPSKKSGDKHDFVARLFGTDQS